jgi:hypothetical protein
MKFKYLLEYLSVKKQIIEHQLSGKCKTVPIKSQEEVNRLKTELEEITEAIKILEKEK